MRRLAGDNLQGVERRSVRASFLTVARPPGNLILDAAHGNASVFRLYPADDILLPGRIRRR